MYSSTAPMDINSLDNESIWLRIELATTKNSSGSSTSLSPLMYASKLLRSSFLSPLYLAYSLLKSFTTWVTMFKFLATEASLFSLALNMDLGKKALADRSLFLQYLTKLDIVVGTPPSLATYISSLFMLYSLIAAVACLSVYPCCFKYSRIAASEKFWSLVIVTILLIVFGFCFLVAIFSSIAFASRSSCSLFSGSISETQSGISPIF